MHSALVVAILIVGALSTVVAQTQPGVDPKLQGQLKQLFPAATIFAESSRSTAFQSVRAESADGCAA